MLPCPSFRKRVARMRKTISLALFAAMWVVLSPDFTLSHARPARSRVFFRSKRSEAMGSFVHCLSRIHAPHDTGWTWATILGASGEYLLVGARANCDGGSSGKALKRAPGRGGGGEGSGPGSVHLTTHRESCRALARSTVVEIPRADAPGLYTPPTAVATQACAGNGEKLLTAAAPAMGRYRQG